MESHVPRTSPVRPALRRSAAALTILPLLAGSPLLAAPAQESVETFVAKERVVRPVDPTRPITSPRLTREPTLTRISLMCA